MEIWDRFPTWASLTGTHFAAPREAEVFLNTSKILHTAYPSLSHLKCPHFLFYFLCLYLQSAFMCFLLCFYYTKRPCWVLLTFSIFFRLWYYTKQHSSFVSTHSWILLQSKQSKKSSFDLQLIEMQRKGSRVGRDVSTLPWRTTNLKDRVRVILTTALPQRHWTHFVIKRSMFFQVCETLQQGQN